MQARAALLGLAALMCLSVTDAHEGSGSTVGPVPVWRPAPGDPMPYDLHMLTLDGNWSLQAVPNPAQLPVLIMAYNPIDAFSRHMWRSQSSVRNFLQKSPPSTHFLFISYGLANDTTMMRSRLLEEMAALNFTQSAVQQQLARFHFSKLPMTGVSDYHANWIPYLMGHWKAPKKVIEAMGPGDWSLTSERLDPAYEWLPWPASPEPHPLVYIGDACSDLHPWDLSGTVALIVPKPGGQADLQCSYAELIANAQAANATAVLIAAPEGRDVDLMTCEGAECSIPLTTPASMIPHAAAAQLQDAYNQGVTSGQQVSVMFNTKQVAGSFAGVNQQGQLVEVGWEKDPTLMHLAWAAQWLEYEAELSANLTRPALVVPVFEEAIMQGDRGVAADITLPAKTILKQYDTLELDLKLSCPGSFDADCPIWDHVVQLFVCCEDPTGVAPPCDKCSATPWMAMQHEGEPEAEAWKASNLVQDALPGDACGRELGRWMTPFRRRIGRWLTDVTPLMPLLSSRQCRFRLQTAPWALPWQPSLRLRFSQTLTPPASGSGSAAGPLAPRPTATLPLFSGGTFDAGYNQRQAPIRFKTPWGLKRAVLSAVITGHGSDENQCAEFCSTSHHFIINGVEHFVNYTEAGTLLGCTEKVREGVEPNEHGTWQYGRNGWCDGQNVRPWLVDLTPNLIPPGGLPNVIEYRGLYQGQTPDPQQQAGYIMMQSNLVFYAEAPAQSGSSATV
ncbi:hypothetical protein WJX72_006713 [[Myrmecia] bisecta]|uniref:Peptide-N-glycosidase F N-terminal domain-containing protein n=1 Tax=[Myrmecia] bisecta TaxID=41462 RepID=A0AAW1Q7G2_9CHLO